MQTEASLFWTPQNPQDIDIEGSLLQLLVCVYALFIIVMDLGLRDPGSLSGVDSLSLLLILLLCALAALSCRLCPKL